MNNLEVAIPILSVAGGWAFFFAFGSKLESWYNDRKERRTNKINERFRSK